MAVTTEIAPNVYRISIFAEWANLPFNHFLVKDAEPLLVHTGPRGMHAEIREAVSKLINLSELRHISFSHFESAPRTYNPVAVRNNDETDELSSGHSPAFYGARHSWHEQGVQLGEL
jgi:hypothetical protein